MIETKLYALWTVELCEISIRRLIEKRGAEARLRYDLSHFLEALAAAGNPHLGLETIIVGGTNGKGSTALLLSSALREAGHRVATYLSPHLRSITERCLLNLEPVAGETLLETLRETEPVAARFELTYFETLTLAFFIWAKRAAPDFVVLEVGMGGRLDATNVTVPRVAVLTNVALDHERFLGSTREEILKDKIRIARPDRPLVTGVADELRPLLRHECGGMGVPVSFADETRLDPGSADWRGRTFSLDGIGLTLSDPSTAQLENARLAFRVLRDHFPRVPAPAIQRGFSRVRFPGKFETFFTEPRVVLCSAHNPHGARMFRDTILGLPRVRRLSLLCGMCGDKDYRRMYDTFREVTDRVLLTTVPGGRGTASPDYRAMGPFIEDPEMAFESLCLGSGPEDIVVIVGSTYLSGALRPLLSSEVAFVSNPPAAPAPFDSARDVSIPAMFP